MKRVLLVLTGIFSLAVLGFGVTLASAEKTQCTGSLGNVTVDGDVIAGPGCNLSNTTVKGDVSVVPGGTLSVSSNSDSPAKIYGNVKSNNAKFIQISSGWIGGDVKLVGTTGIDGEPLTGVHLENSTVEGDVTIKEGSAFIVVLDMQIGGDVEVHDNRGSDPSGQYGWVIGVVGSTVGGHVRIYDNDASGSFFNQIGVTTSLIRRNLHVHSNTATGGSAANAVLIFLNQVHENLLVNKNIATGPDGSSSFVDVSGNTVGRTLNCRNNTPDPTDSEGVGLNVALRKRAECADL